MQFAIYEAATGQFPHIEPEHMLMALLKVSELRRDEVDKLAQGASNLIVEIEAVRNELLRRRIDSTSLRRELRAKKGQGGSPFQGGILHRSPETRRLFDRAVEFAAMEGTGSVKANHILQAVLASPTPLVEQVLGHAATYGMKDNQKATLLDKYGKNLTALAREGKLPSGTDRKAESKALAQVLHKSDKPAVFLISDSHPIFESVITATVLHMSKEDADNVEGTRRVIDVTNARGGSEWDTETLGRLRGIFSETSGLEDVVLVVPPLEPAGTESRTDDWIDLMESFLVQQSVKCLCRVDPEVYRTRIETRASWKRLGDVMWIRDKVNRDIPMEL